MYRSSSHSPLGLEGRRSTQQFIFSGPPSQAGFLPLTVNCVSMTGDWKSCVRTETIPLLHKFGWHSGSSRLERIRSGYSIFLRQLWMSVAAIKANIGVYLGNRLWAVPNKDIHRARLHLSKLRSILSLICMIEMAFGFSMILNMRLELARIRRWSLQWSLRQTM